MSKIKVFVLLLLVTMLIHSCTNSGKEEKTLAKYDPQLSYKQYNANPADLVISRADYHDKLYGFWLAQCIANWTGLVTEMEG
jgi:hypothetical protein